MTGLRKSIERRHGEDPGMADGFVRCLDGIISARRGIKRAESLVKGNNGAREIELVRAKLDEAEMWLGRAAHGVKSEPYPPPGDQT